MEKHPLISVVLTTCDRPSLCERALRSCAAQTDRRFEVILIDDGTIPLDIDFSCLGVELIYHYTGGKKGAPFGRNVGSRLATTAWITFLDDDDFLGVDRIKNLIGFMQGDDSATYKFLGTTTVKVEGDSHSRFKGDVPGIFGLHDFFEQCIVGISCLIRKDLLVEAGGFDEEMTGSQDWELWMRVLKHGGKMIKWDTLDYFATLDSPNRITSSIKRATGFRKILEKHGACMSPTQRNYFLCLSRLAGLNRVGLFEVLLECYRHRTIMPLKVALKIEFIMSRNFFRGVL
ncbi:glycosyltransferase family 2 protein [Pseudoduganella sp. GCM10020061]|uniref:glycosyltransferase family 2 protein n=1 Tax=Pseudoduganella sp. GCM10020061 TaxID=3317345 RepID=UPI003637D5FC